MGVRVDYKNIINVDDLDTIYMTGAGYVRYPFKGISRDSGMAWEEAVWSSELNRTVGSFAIENIEKVDFGLVPRVDVSFKYMNVQDYLVLCKMSKERFITVDAYYRDLGERRTLEMSFTKNELGKLYAFGREDIGRQDIRVTLSATNREKAKLIDTEYTISYDSNTGSGSIAPQTVTFSNVIQLADGSQFTKSGYHIREFNTKPDGSGDKYLPNQRITVFKNLKLYAIWE